MVADDRDPTFDGRGISRPVWSSDGTPGWLRGASVADKVVGKGAAALLILGGVRELFAGVVSTSALGLLKDSGIPVRFSQEVAHIVNRKGDGVCPVETLCKECTTAAQCLPLIREFVAKIKNNI